MEMKYLTPEPWFHMFEAESSQAAFSFADESEAAHFRNIVLGRLGYNNILIKIYFGTLHAKNLMLIFHKFNYSNFRKLG